MTAANFRVTSALGTVVLSAALLGGCGSGSKASSVMPTAQPPTAATSSTAEHLVRFEHLTVHDPAYLHRSDSPDFVDHTLPAGRMQGRAGIVAASQTFRTAVPDLHCTVADVLVSGDEVSVRQVYSGHFTGSYDGVPGHGQVLPLARPLSSQGTTRD